MQRKAKLLYKEWLFVFIAWLVMFYFYFFIAFWGSSTYFREGAVTSYLNTWYAHLEIILTALSFGLLFNLINHITSRTILHIRSLGYILFIKSSLYLTAIFITGFVVYGIFLAFDIMAVKDPVLLEETINPRFFISIGLYFIFCIIFINFILQINKKFGPGNLIKMITGRYHKPRNEEKIFLFLDMKSSTTIAESLGHDHYSQLLQHCFHDLTENVIKYEADIYQFVGDEVVLSWNLNKGFKKLNCIKIFFAFEKTLLKNKNFYLENFDVYPEFRGGMDMGGVTVTEIGDIKREIAYHGDVLNTASRIQGQCKNLKQKLLISENLAQKLNFNDTFSSESMGEIRLRGKNNLVRVYSINFYYI